MSKKATIDDLKAIVKEFCEERDWSQYHNPKDLAIGISTEANELLDIFRFKSLEQVEQIMNTPEKRKRVEEELADTFFFILRFAQMNNINLEKALRAKLMINDEKYPKELVYGKNDKYNE
jgi:NTP pyrophosphatase (non-canonical NTP hydrolase)